MKLDIRFLLFLIFLFPGCARRMEPPGPSPGPGAVKAPLRPPPPFKDWIEDLDHQDPGTRLKASRALMASGRKALPAVLRGLGHSRPRVREGAQVILNAVVENEGILALVACLEHPDGDVGLIASRVLGESGDSDTVLPVISRLGHARADVRALAADTLGLLGDERAIPSLLQALGDRSREVFASAAVSLALLGDPHSVHPLLTLFQDPKTGTERRIDAALALVEIEGDGLVDAMTRSLSDPEPRIRSTAAWILGELGTPEAMTALVGALKDEDAQVRFSAVSALEDLADVDAVGPLIQRLRDNSLLVRRKAAEVLAAVTGKKHGESYDAWMDWWRQKGR